jgi:adenylate kinase family enzyme
MNEKKPISSARIMIFGIPGSGKSTFAVHLGSRLNLPVFHLDKYFFIKDWQERDYEEFLQIQRGLVEKNAWIIDGNATRSLEMRFSRADSVLYFRFNRFLCLWRIFKRLVFKDHRISDRAEGCSENVRLRLIPYLWGFDQRVRLNIQNLRKQYPDALFHELRNQKDLELVMESTAKMKMPAQPKPKF